MASYGYLQITRLCNQCCLFCSNPENQNSISFEQGAGYIDTLADDGGYDGVILTGGEPTLSDDLPRYLDHCSAKGLKAILMTNGQKLADRAYLDSLIDSGLSIVTMSLYSVNPEIQALLTGNDDSFANFTAAAENISDAGCVSLEILITLNKYNANHFSHNVEFIKKNFPRVTHFIFNNLDPLMNRASENPDTIPMLNDIDLQLDRSVALLRKWKKTLRIERVPLCYMGGFEHLSTETRRIVKNEKCRIHFLDEKGEVDKAEDDSNYGKAPCCEVCYLNEICAGLYSMDTHYSSEELFPVFHITKDEVVEKVLSEVI